MRIRVLAASTFQVLVTVVLGGGVGGCAALPLEEIPEAERIEIRLLQVTSSRTLHPGERADFDLVLVNHSARAVRLGDLRVTLEAVSEAQTEFPTRLPSPTWSYRNLDVSLPPERQSRLRLKPELLEFPLSLQPPGAYEVRATVLERFVSAPLTVRVLVRSAL